MSEFPNYLFFMQILSIFDNFLWFLSTMEPCLFKVHFFTVSFYSILVFVDSPLERFPSYWCFLVNASYFGEFTPCEWAGSTLIGRTYMLFVSFLHSSTFFNFHSFTRSGLYKVKSQNCAIHFKTWGGQLTVNVKHYR